MNAMAPSDYTPPERRFTGRAMLAAMLAFFGVIIGVNALMLVLAVNSFGGLVVDNSYVASQNFDRDIAAARAQPIHGWTLGIAAGRGMVAVDMRGAEGAPLRGLSPVFAATRPTHGRGAVEAALTESAPGLYTAVLPLAPGRWRGTVVTGDGQTRSLPFTVRPDP